MRWYKGLLYILIAVVSLGVILLWPHAKYPYNFSAIGSSQKSEVSPYGFPFEWLKIEAGEHWGSAPDAVQPTKYEEKQIETSKLLFNLIIWGVLMLFVELSIRGYNKKRST